MKTIKDIIDTVGSPYRVAQLLGIDPSAPYSWIKKQAIPVKYWEQLDALIPELTINLLYQIHKDADVEGNTIWKLQENPNRQN